MATALVFPGQGSQSVGMGKALAEAFPAAREVFARVDAALGQSLSRVIFEGPEADLTLTTNAQPALMATSLAVVRVLESEAGLDIARDVAFVAGHSLGEYSALCAAGALTLEDAARLLRIRGDAMQRAVPVDAGAMAAILGLEFDEVAAVAAAATEELAMAMAKAKGAKRALALPVSAPFHCSLMRAAATAMAEALATTAISAPKAPLIANVTASPVTAPAAIRENLVAQVTGTVRWRECVLAMNARGVTRFVEAGAGKVLTGLVKRIAPGASALSVGSPADVAAYAAQCAA